MDGIRYHHHISDLKAMNAATGPKDMLRGDGVFNSLGSGTERSIATCETACPMYNKLTGTCDSTGNIPRVGHDCDAQRISF